MAASKAIRFRELAQLDRLTHGRFSAFLPTSPRPLWCCADLLVSLLSVQVREMGL